jgi:hypothetical protein
MNDIQNLVVIFDYNKEQLEALKNQFSAVDKENKDEIDNAVKVLVKARGIIQKQGKALRDSSNAYNKAVLAKEKEYVDIIEPLEIELKERLVEIKNKEIIEVRKELLPMKKDQLALLTTISQPTDDFILSLDDSAWVEYYASQMKLEKDNKDAEIQKAKDLELQKEREAEIAKQTEERIKRDLENAKILKDQQEKREAEEKAKAELERKAKLLADEKYQSWLNENNFNEATDKTVEKDGVVRLYRLISEFNK